MLHTKSQQYVCDWNSEGKTSYNNTTSKSFPFFGSVVSLVTINFYYKNSFLGV